MKMEIFSIVKKVLPKIDLLSSTKKLYVRIVVLPLILFLLVLTGCDLFESLFSIEDVSSPTFSQPSGTFTDSVDVTISCTTNGAEIRYTIDGTDPSDNNGTVITSGSSVKIKTSITLKAIAYKDGMTTSDPASVNYTISLSTPTFSQTGGAFTDSVDVTISCITTDATIRYTTDGSIPSITNGTVITSGSFVNITTSTTLKAIAYKDSMITSSISSEYYQINSGGTVSTPTFSQTGGTFTDSVDVTISCTTNGAEIRYTIDGTDPSDNNGTVITSGSSVNITTSTTLKAIAYKDSMITSSISSEYYQINSGGTVSTPTFSPTGGTFTDSVDVTITCTTNGAEIRYTIDGTDPSDNNGTVITSGSSVKIKTSITLKAIAYKDGMTTSDPASVNYTISLSTPTFSPTGGTFTDSVDVTISCITSDATIRYTTDGSIPSITNGTMITSGSSINITTSITLKAIGYKDGMTTSSITSEAYNINPPGTVSTPIFSKTGGSFTDSVDVTISCTTVDAIIRYTTDGSIPTKTYGTVITSDSSVNITTTTTLKAIAYKDDLTDSSIAIATFTKEDNDDDINPVIGAFSIEGSDEYTDDRDITLNISATDNVNVAKMRFSNNGSSWKTYDYKTTKLWTLSSGDGEKTVFAQVQDSVKNWSSGANDKIILDTTNPSVGTFSINNGGTYTNSRNVTLYISSASDSGSGVERIRIKNNGGSWSYYDYTTTSKSWKLASGDGTKRVYMRIYDKAGNYTEKSDTIVLDTTAPTINSFSINNGASDTNSTSVTLNISASGNPDQMRFSNDEKDWSSWKSYHSSENHWIISASEDSKASVYVQIRDTLKNTSSKSDNIYLDAKSTIKVLFSSIYVEDDGDNGAGGELYWTFSSDVVGGSYSGKNERLKDEAWSVMNNTSYKINTGWFVTIENKDTSSFTVTCNIWESDVLFDDYFGEREITYSYDNESWEIGLVSSSGYGVPTESRAKVRVYWTIERTDYGRRW